MKKFIFPSLILVFLFSIVLLFRNSETLQAPAYIRWGHLVIDFLTTFLIIRRYKIIYSNNVIQFGDAFKYGLKITFFYAVFTTIIYFFYIKLNEDSFRRAMEAQMKAQMEMRLEMDGSLSASMEKTMKTMFTIMCNPFVVTGITFISSLIGGIIYSLISAAILKSKTVETEN